MEEQNELMIRSINILQAMQVLILLQKSSASATKIKVIEVTMKVVILVSKIVA